MNIDLKATEATLADPIFGKTVTHLETFVSFGEAAKLPLGSANVRQASHVKKPWKAMLSTVQLSPRHFHLLNRGVIYRAKNTTYDAKNQVLKVTMPDEDQRYGVADGGHTLDVIHYAVENREALLASLSEEQRAAWVEPYVRIRFIIGEELTDDLDTIVEALNTSTQVQQYTLDEYHGAFEDIKDALEDGGWDLSQVSFRENDPAEWDVREIVQRLSIFLRDRWEGEPPMAAYKSRARSMRLFTDPNTHAQYTQLYPLLNDLVALPERIQAEFSLGDSLTSRRKIDQLPHVTALAKPTIRPGAPQAWTTAHRFSLGAMLPLAAAFRELVTVEDGKAVWSQPLDTVLCETAQDLYDLLVKRSKVARTANALGTDVEYWSQATSIVLRAIAKHGTAEKALHAA